MTVRGKARGKTIELDEALPFPAGQPLDIHIEPATAEAAIGSPARLLEAVRQPPHVSAEDAAEFQRAIQSGTLVPDERGVFDDPAAQA